MASKRQCIAVWCGETEISAASNLSIKAATPAQRTAQPEPGPARRNATVPSHCDAADHACGRLDVARLSLTGGLLFRNWIVKSSIRFPELNCATSQRGCLPRPAQALTADQDCGILGGPAGTAGALTREFATVSGALPVGTLHLRIFSLQDLRNLKVQLAQVVNAHLLEFGSFHDHHDAPSS